LLVNRDFEIQTPLQRISTRLLFIDFQSRLHYFHAVQCMPKAKVWRKTWAEHDIQKALDYLRAGHSSNISKTADKFGVPRRTLGNRWHNRSDAARAAHRRQQHLSNAEEEALADWIVHRSDIARPLNKRTLLRKLERIIGRKPSPMWYRRFLKRHPNVRLGKPSGLDPKRAQSFNRATINEHFVQLGEVLDKHNIPWSNVYNMDEKGCQRGGGRRMQAIKYFIPRNRRPQYKLRSANLELVTIIECICADGESLKPGFIFPGKEFHPEWFQVDNGVR
jgi:hypothetical protein